MIGLMVAGCGGSGHPAAAPNAAPKVTPSAAPASTAGSGFLQIQSAALAECKKFLPTVRKVVRVARSISTNSELAATLSTLGGAWERQMDSAANQPQRYGVPHGHNVANQLAVDISKASFDMGLTGLAADSNLLTAPKKWTKTIHDMTAAVKVCNNVA